MNIVDAAKLAVLIQEHIPQHLWLALVWSLNHEFPDLEWYEHEDRAACGISE